MISAKRKGFTLLELVIVIGVSAVLMSTVVLLMVSISNYTSKRATTTGITEEHNAVRSFLATAFSTYDSPDDPQIDKISFEGNTLTYCKQTLQCKYLTSASLDCDDIDEKIYKFELTYLDGNERQTYRIVLVSRVG